MNIYGVGVDTAAVLLVTAGDNAARIHSEGSLGDAVWHRPDPGHERQDRQPLPAQQRGDRHANNAIWRIVITRLGQHEPRTVAYMNRRLAEGKSKPDIIRCLIG